METPTIQTAVQQTTWVELFTPMVIKCTGYSTHRKNSDNVQVQDFLDTLENEKINHVYRNLVAKMPFKEKSN